MQYTAKNDAVYDGRANGQGVEREYVWSSSLKTCAVGTPLSNAVTSQKQHAVLNNMASHSAMVERMGVWDQYVELEIRMQVVLAQCNYSYLEIR